MSTYLHRAEEAAAEWEAADVCGAWLPGGGPEEVCDLWKHLFNHSMAAADADLLSELCSHVNHHALRTRASTFLLPPPVLQLGLQRSQLEETGLLVQQREFLQPSNATQYPQYCRQTVRSLPLESPPGLKNPVQVHRYTPPTNEDSKYSMLQLETVPLPDENSTHSL